MSLEANKGMEITAEGLLIHLKVTAKTSREEWGDLKEGRIQVKLTAPPVEGQANEACILFLAKSFKCPKSQIKLVRGERSREKTFLLSRYDPDRLKAWKEKHINQ